MDSLKSSPTLFATVFSNRPAENPRAFLSTLAWNRSSPSRKLEHCFLASGKSTFLQQKQICATAQTSSISTGLEADVETLGIDDDIVQVTNHTKTAHVKFQLKKECQFGQRFFLTGEDPIFGQWDSANAVPLEWSEGHVWSLELDIPVGKTIHFKFILKGMGGEIQWQPDPDRVLNTWDTDKTIVVLEDWESAQLQQVTEEEVADALAEKMIVDSEEPMLVPVDTTDESTFSESIIESNGRLSTNLKNKIVKDEEIISISEDAPVLVPGLDPALPDPELGME